MSRQPTKKQDSATRAALALHELRPVAGRSPAYAEANAALGDLVADIGDYRTQIHRAARLLRAGMHEAALKVLEGAEPGPMFDAMLGEAA